MTAPYRADHVGSLLRPAPLAKARAAHFDAESVSASQLRELEDGNIADAVKMQQSVGLLAVTDGEYRRAFWHYDFMEGLTGMEFYRKEESEGVQFDGVKLPPLYPKIASALDFPADHPMLDHYRYLASIATVQPKISIPGPSCCHFRTAKEDIKPVEYQDTQKLLDDLAGCYAKAVQAFYDAGCRYLQMDDIFFAYLCDPKHRAAKKAAGEDPDWLIGAYADTLERAIANRPSDMRIAMHLCRGNFRSTHAAEGAYDPAADAIFNRTSIDIYFMEYDTERAGGLEPLRLLPKGKKRVLPGFITTKTGELESVDDLRRKLDQAASHIDLDQLGIAPQCGFASTDHGNSLSPDEQRRKLELVVETANAVWGGVDA